MTTTITLTPAQLLADMNHQRTTAPLSILSLAEPILRPDTQPQPFSQSQSQSLSQPQHGATTDSASTAASLTLDLQHYRDLFSKLRFSYLEQVTKEKYLRSIVGEPPTTYTSAQNAELEEKLTVQKADLQAKKRAVEQLVQEMEVLARDIAVRYDAVEEGRKELEVLPGECEALEAEVQSLREMLRDKEGERVESEDPRMNLSLEETERLIEEQRARREELQAEIEGYERDLPEKIRSCEKAERELEEVEGRRNEITRLARDAQKRKAGGAPSGVDVLEMQGRWYRGSEVVMRGLLGMEA